MMSGDTSGKKHSLLTDVNTSHKPPMSPTKSIVNFYDTKKIKAQKSSKYKKELELVLLYVNTKIQFLLDQSCSGS